MPNNYKISLEDAPLNSFHKKLAVYSSGAPFLDGYILSIIGVVMAQISQALQMNALQEGMVAAAALVGMFLGGFVGGLFTDRLGRKTLYVLVLVALAVFSLGQFWVTSAWALIVLRLLLGIAIGADHPLATSLLAEFLPKKHRGSILASLVLMWFVGAAVAYVAGEVILRTAGPDAWRWALASAVVPAVLFLIMRAGTPESARWLLSKGRTQEADQVIKKVYGSAFSVANLPEAPRSRHVSVWSLFHSSYGKRIFFVSVFWTCSIIPQFAIYAFAPKILHAMGLTGDLAAWGAVAITIMFVFGCLLAVKLINPLGRRNLLMHSFLWSGLALLLLGLFPEGSAQMTLMLFGSYALFIGGAQVLQYVYPNELFPTEIRGSAVGLSTSLSRIGAAVGTYLVPLSLDSIGIANTMIAAFGISMVGLLVTWLMAPETRSMDLHQASAASY
ncbi:TPA: MFS transporter [Pseudomonas aeruginosa]|uniref:MFS transporter n=1 Tax=Pseudomonas TaxID=286 RepID=UPI000CD3F3C6|nr:MULTISPECIES: MFS transporter [Pseudomonas]MBH9519096.1 MFS transporter [Pseudomonas aeruginosa]MBI8577253.1 MFS transporter [Pseudomonas aeruginosa]MBI8804372.1 MFS transporter [Pseudomonas aeruginosa]MCU9208625.1 MFS transporter [Pseudomonas aeruginosa]MDA3374368.1 MFS transporter [Pseudomonas aeruginosa]